MCRTAGNGSAAKNCGILFRIPQRNGFAWDSDGFCFVCFIFLTAADGFVGFAVFFEAFFCTAVAVTVAFKGDLEVFLEDSVQNYSDGSDADDGTDDGENGLERAALLVFHNNTSISPVGRDNMADRLCLSYGETETTLQNKYSIKLKNCNGEIVKLL